jgi:hypothetical protein
VKAGNSSETWWPYPILHGFSWVTMNFWKETNMAAVQISEFKATVWCTTPWRCIGGMEVYFHAFLISALDGGEWSACSPATLHPRKELLLARWAPEPVWTRWWREKFLAPVGTRTPDHQACSLELYHWATLTFVPNPRFHAKSWGVKLEQGP